MENQANTVQQELSMTYDKVLVAGSTKGAMKEAKAASRDRWQVPVTAIEFLPNFNVRIKNDAYWARVRRYADSMKLVGFKQDKPLSGIVIVENGVQTIKGYGGYTRWDALALANKELAAEGRDQITSVPMVIAPSGTTIEDLTDDLVTGNNGEQLQPFEIGIVCKRKQSYGSSVEDIARDLGFSPTYVETLLFLMGAPKLIRDMVQNDQVGALEAVRVMREKGDKAVEVLQQGLERVASAGKTRVTAKFMPGAAQQKAIKKAAPEMVDTLKEIKKDPGYATLQPEIQQKLDQLLRKLDEAEQETAKSTPEEKTEMQ